MASTFFEHRKTPIQADWLNDVNYAVYNKLSELTSVKDFGAVGDGVTDDTAAIQAAINSLPLNTIDVGIQSPKGFANGGMVFLPRGRYKVTGKITMRRGLRLVGESAESTQIISFISADSVFQYTDQGRYAPDEITLESLSIWQDASVVATAGAAIDVIEGPATVDAVKLAVRNVHIEGTYRGVRLGAGIGCSLESVGATKCVQSGFNIKAGITTTSTSFKNCYASLTTAGSGFDLEAGAYVSFVSCASDSNFDYGYKITGAKAVAFLATGAEANKAFGLFTGCESITGSIFCIGNSVDGVQLSSCGEVALSGVLDGTTGTGVNVLVASGPITFLGMKFKNTYATSRCNSVFKVLDLEADGRLVGGTGNRWGIGVVQQPDSESTFNVGGNGGSATTVGLKTNVSFSVAGASRNIANSLQAVTANTAVTYPMVMGQFILNASKGAAATHDRSVGSFIQEQTTGTTANANLVTGTTGSDVPVGSWNIYSNSTRANYLAGSLTFVPASSATPGANGDLTFERTSNTSLTVKLRGTDGVVRSVSLTLA